jgi:hypothetical protein
VGSGTREPVAFVFRSRAGAAVLRKSRSVNRAFRQPGLCPVYGRRSTRPAWGLPFLRETFHPSSARDVHDAYEFHIDDSVIRVVVDDAETQVIDLGRRAGD